MTQKSIALSTPIGQKTNPLFYLLTLVLLGILGVIVEKHVSMPQGVIRPIGAMLVATLFFSAFIKPHISLVALALYMPFSRVLVGDFGTESTGFNLTNVLIGIAIIGWLASSLKTSDKVMSKASLNAPIMFFIGWGLLSLLKASFFYGSDYTTDFLIPFKRWFTPIILYFIALNIVKDKRVLKNVIIAMMFVTVIVGLMASYDYLDVRYASSIDKARVGGVFEQPNTLGGFFVYNMFLFLGFIFTHFPNIAYMTLIIPFLVCFRGIMVTFSRGAYLGCAFGSIAIAFFKSKILFLLAVFLLIYVVINPMVLPPGVRTRMSGTYRDGDIIISTDIDSMKDASVQNRFIIWKGGIQMIRDYPLLGVGYGVFPLAISKYAPIANADAHNTYIILAGEMGVPALLAFMVILLLMIKNSRWLYRKSKDKFIRAFALGMLGNLFGLLIVNMFGSRLNSEEVSAYFWIYAGLIMAAVNLTKKEIEHVRISQVAKKKSAYRKG